MLVLSITAKNGPKNVRIYDRIYDRFLTVYTNTLAGTLGRPVSYIRTRLDHRVRFQSLVFSFFPSVVRAVVV